MRGWEAVQQRARAQHGVITQQQVEAAGVPVPALRWRLRSRLLEPVHRGVYRIAGAPVTWNQHALALVLATGPEAVLSHRTAAWLHALDGFDRAAPWPIDFTLPRSVRRRAPRGARLHRAEVPPRAVWVRRLPVTTPARTVLDLAPTLDDAALAFALDSAYRRSPALPTELRRLLDAGRWEGAPRLERLLALRLSPTESPLEGRVLMRLLAARLRPPAHQLQLHDADGPIVRVDFAWPAERVALHVDSFRWHCQRERFELDHTHRTRLAAVGWASLGVTDAMVGRERWLQWLRATLARRAPQLGFDWDGAR